MRESDVWANETASPPALPRREGAGALIESPFNDDLEWEGSRKNRKMKKKKTQPLLPPSLVEKEQEDQGIVCIYLLI
jgi:hypothetical protein